MQQRLFVTLVTAVLIHVVTSTESHAAIGSCSRVEYDVLIRCAEKSSTLHGTSIDELQELLTASGFIFPHVQEPVMLARSSEWLQIEERAGISLLPPHIQTVEKNVLWGNGVYIVIPSKVVSTETDFLMLFVMIAMFACATVSGLKNYAVRWWNQPMLISMVAGVLGGIFVSVVATILLDTVIGVIIGAFAGATVGISTGIYTTKLTVSSGSKSFPYASLPAAFGGAFAGVFVSTNPLYLHEWLVVCLMVMLLALTTAICKRWRLRATHRQSV